MFNRLLFPAIIAYKIVTSERRCALALLSHYTWAKPSLEVKDKFSVYICKFACIMRWCSVLPPCRSPVRHSNSVRCHSRHPKSNILKLIDPFAFSLISSVQVNTGEVRPGSARAA